MDNKSLPETTGETTDMLKLISFLKPVRMKYINNIPTPSFYLSIALADPGIIGF
jgi:hypothetical protein